MEDNVDKYSHKLSVKNNIGYEIARDALENKIDKLKNEKKHSNNIAKTAYKDIRFNMKGGNIKTYKIIYNL